MDTLNKSVIQYIKGGGFGCQLPNGEYVYIDDEEEEEEDDMIFG